MHAFNHVFGNFTTVLCYWHDREKLINGDAKKTNIIRAKNTGATGKLVSLQLNYWTWSLFDACLCVELPVAYSPLGELGIPHFENLLFVFLQYCEAMVRVIWVLKIH